ncbi:PREDICTED: uncharacterized protein LOC105566773 isoform X4 [Vollenhovia emeryi]|uniref:uncharacterized protein LOC105566773 isoform X4 n=1 Tax=Vollenhovia emeryi TaxID=411798 RepID=UPI0005F457A8|nr:PREDICTED: uncharacterized protein LOC105566773 isoform X4 [Vollenhovia emeryi]
MSEADNFVLVTRRGKRRGGRRSSSGKAATPGVTVEQDREVDRELLLRQELLKVPEGFWSTKEEPRYLTKDVEFVTATQ